MVYTVSLFQLTQFSFSLSRCNSSPNDQVFHWEQQHFQNIPMRAIVYKRKLITGDAGSSPHVAKEFFQMIFRD